MLHTTEKCIALFDSIHDVLQAEKTLKQANVAVTVVPTPRTLAVGCSLSLSFECRLEKTVRELLKQQGFGVRIVMKGSLRNEAD